MPSFRFRGLDLIVYGAVILMAALIAILVISPWRNFAASDETLYGILTVDGREVWRADLEGTATQEYTFPLADGSLTIRAGDGKAQVISSDCRDQVCVRTGIITIPGQTVVCLPHHAVLSIVSERDTSNPDPAPAALTGDSSGDVDIIVR